MKYYQTYEEYTHSMKYIIDDIKERTDKPYIVGVFRGSLGMAAQVSNILDCPMGIIQYQTRDGGDKEPIWLLKDIPEDHTVVVLDDIYDTGKTLIDISKIVPEDTLYYTLFNNTAAERVPNNLEVTSAKDSNGEWIVFPWETV